MEARHREGVRLALSPETCVVESVVPGLSDKEVVSLLEICCQPERILRNAEYRQGYETYDPPEELISALRAVERQLTFLIVFGYWCKDSARVVPQTLKALAVADNPNLRVLLVHVAYSETDPSPFMAGPIVVRRYPTISVLKGHYEHTAEISAEAELVRFVEEPLDAHRLTHALQ